jgi:hypothetical protein
MIDDDPWRATFKLLLAFALAEIFVAVLVRVVTGG